MSVELVTAGDTDYYYYLFGNRLYDCNEITPIDNQTINARIALLNNLDQYHSPALVIFQSSWTLFDIVGTELVMKASYGTENDHSTYLNPVVFDLPVISGNTLRNTSSFETRLINTDLLQSRYHPQNNYLSINLGVSYRYS